MTEMIVSGVCQAGTTPQELFAGFLPDWQLLSAAALLVSVGTIALLYLINRFFQNSEGMGWAKLELYEVFITVVIMIGVFAAADLACNVRASWLFPAPSAPQDYNIYEASNWYLDQFSSSIMDITTALYGLYSGLDMISSMTLTGRPLGVGTQVQPTGGLAATVKPGLTNAFNVLVIAFIVNKVQIFLINFVSFGYLKYYLPLGLLARSFTPTRRIGGTVIAIALGFLFVYPFLTILEGEAGLKPILSLRDNIIQDFWSDASGVAGNDFVSWWEDSTREETLGGSALAVLDFVGLVVRSAIGFLAFGLLYLSANAAGYAFMVGLFFPAFNTLILVTTIRYLSKSMGEEIDVTNLTRLI
ncbi:MAG: hypothetical protein AB1657_01225 [Candidatus Micrarchaeota archaeon]